MIEYTKLSEELNKLPQERQKMIQQRTSQIRLEEITLDICGKNLVYLNFLYNSRKCGFLSLAMLYPKVIR